MRNGDTLEHYFALTQRRVTVVELFIGFANVLLVVWELYYNLPVFFNLPLLPRILECVMLYVSWFRYLWICYILELFLADINRWLKHHSDEDVLLSYKQSCIFLEAVSSVLGSLHDHILCYSSGCLVILESTATFSQCDVVLNLITWVSHVAIPILILVSLGEETTKLMSAKRVRLRRMWPQQEDRITEFYAVNGHRNALGLRWIVRSEYMNYSSALPAMANVFACASLILTTPAFLENRFYDVFCYNLQVRE